MYYVHRSTWPVFCFSLGLGILTQPLTEDIHTQWGSYTPRAFSGLVRPVDYRLQGTFSKTKSTVCSHLADTIACKACSSFLQTILPWISCNKTVASYRENRFTHAHMHFGPLVDIMWSLHIAIFPFQLLCSTKDYRGMHTPYTCSQVVYTCNAHEYVLLTSHYE